jgi:energy-converting hydrogenase Eha subunit H
MSWILAAPIIIPFATAVLAFLFRRGPEGRWLSVVGSTGLLIASGFLMAEVLREGVVAAQMGQWAAPFGITLVADLLSAVMVVITGITGLAVAIYALSDVDEAKEALGYHALFQVLLAGVCGAFLTGDLFNLYVWFEVMLIASFGLLILGGRREQLDGGIKYVTLNLVSTILFLSGVGLLYGMTGTLNMADLHGAVQTVDNPGLLIVIAVMFMIAFGVKAAVFPLFFWLPASYHTPAFSVSAIFAGLLTKVGVYALIRVFTLIFTTDVAYTHTILLWVAGFTMVTGVLGAAAMNDFRRILSVPHRQPDRIHDPRPRALHAIGDRGGGVLPRPPHHREGEPVPRGGRGEADCGVHGPFRHRRALQDRAASGGAVPDPRLLAGRVSTAQRVLGEIRSGQGITRCRGLLDRRRCARRGAPDDLLDDEDLGQRVLETAPGGP